MKQLIDLAAGSAGLKPTVDDIEPLVFDWSDVCEIVTTVEEDCQDCD